MADRRWRRRAATVRFRVTALATVAVLFVLVVTGVVLVLHQRQVMTEALDEAIDIEADDLERDLPTTPSTLEPLFDDDGVAQVVAGDRVVAATANLRGRAPLVPPPTNAAPAAGERFRNLDGVLDDEPAFRVLSRTVTTADGVFVVHVGASIDDIEESATLLKRSLLVALPLVIAVLAGLVWVLVGRTLAPVEAIRAEVAAIGAAGLHRRVPDPGTGDEVGQLAGTMNAMLDRLEDAARRQQQFVADAAHELRSPLTRIRSGIEVDLARPDDADLPATHRSVLADAADLERLVDDLLVLARADAGVVDATDDRPVDLDDLVLRHARRVRDRGHVAVDASDVSAAQVFGDPRQLTRAIGNLIDNAVRHASHTITLGLTEDGEEAVLAVADDGPGIPVDQRERVFDRFVRIDSARTHGGGAGLGLAIVRDIVERHRGTVAIDPDHPGGARFVVRLPRAADG